MSSLWRLQLRPGSFRGVKFFCDSHEYEGGRRIVDHLFPYRDSPWTEDFGRKQDIYNLNLYVIGDDYFAIRDQLVAALNSAEGPGILVHPYLGDKTVEVGDFRLSESKEEGGLAKISVTFRATGRIPSPQGGLSFIDQARSTAQKVQLALVRAFSAFNSPNPTSFVFQSATDLVSGVSAVLSTAAQGVPSDANSIADFAYAVRNLKGNSRALVARPGQLSAAIKGAMNLLTDTLNLDGLLPEDSNGRVIITADAAVKAAAGYTLRQVFKPIINYGTGLPATLETTDSRRLEANNQRLMKNLIVGSALAEATIVGASTSYGTYQDALEYRDYLVDQIETLMNDPLMEDDVYDGLQALVAVAVESIPDPTTEAPRLSRINLLAVTSSLVVSYDLYENIENESDIIARNRLSHPGFILPTKPLEVLAGD